MAIKIIKEGKITKFRKTCPDCGCEFEYDASDVSTDYGTCLTTYPPQYNTYVACPCCKKHILHGTTQAANLTAISPKIYYTDTSMQYTYDCDGCPNKPDPNKITAGDMPCTWCKKRQPYCVSDGITYKSTSTSYTVDPKDFKATTYTPDSYAIPKIKDKCEQSITQRLKPLVSLPNIL